MFIFTPLQTMEWGLKENRFVAKSTRWKAEKNMVTENEKKIPSNYFLYPEFRAFVLLPICWGLLPIAGFYPELLGGFLPDMFLWTKPIEIIIKLQVSTSTFFKTFEMLHLHFYV